ncbi:MAG TPA: Hpt domain-containing protein, partial [Symbiobacteriaceae bacterium]|nr:Hpt domain-containing protein [Symbiobacteriaceae bacterium]
MGFDFDMSAEDIKVFLDEAEEQLQAMEAGILKLEKEGDNPEHLQEIFRAAHTLKGSSATLGHKKMAEVTHSMENVLDKLRKGKLALTTVVGDTLLACLDVLQAFKEEIATGEESGVGTAEIMERLSLIDNGNPAGNAATAASAPVNAGVPGLPGDMPALSAQEEKALAAAQQAGKAPYWLVLTLDKNSPMPAVRAFQALLAVGDVGEIVRSWPTQQDVEEDRIGEDLKVLFATTTPEEKVRSVVGAVPEVAITTLAPLAPADAVPTSALVAAETAAAVMAADALTAASPELASADKVKSPDAKLAKSESRTVRVNVEVLDNLMSLVGELVIERTRLGQVLTRLEMDKEGDEIVQIMSSALAQISRMTSNLQDEIQRARMLPVDNLFRKFPRMVRDTAQKANKEIEFVVLGQETELDRSVIEEIGDPLMHLL